MKQEKVEKSSNEKQMLPVVADYVPLYSANAVVNECPFLALKPNECDRHLNSDRLSLSTVPDSGTVECSRAVGYCIICKHASVESMGRLDKIRGLRNVFLRSRDQRGCGLTRVAEVLSSVGDKGRGGAGRG